MSLTHCFIIVSQLPLWALIQKGSFLSNLWPEALPSAVSVLSALMPEGSKAMGIIRKTEGENSISRYVENQE